MRKKHEETGFQEGQRIKCNSVARMQRSEIRGQCFNPGIRCASSGLADVCFVAELAPLCCT